VGFNFGGRKTFSKAKNPGQCGVPVDETLLATGRIMARVGVLSSPTAYVTKTCHMVFSKSLDKFWLIWRDGVILAENLQKLGASPNSHPKSRTLRKP
jgi:hypothetical protein